MGLSSDDRGMLEKIIDMHIQNIPNYVDFARAEGVKKGFLINNEYDFVMGEVFQGIISSFSDYYMTKLKQSWNLPDPQQLQDSMNEIVGVLIKRMAEVRKAIFDCG